MWIANNWTDYEILDTFYFILLASGRYSKLFLFYKYIFLFYFSDFLDYCLYIWLL